MQHNTSPAQQPPKPQQDASTYQQYQQQQLQQQQQQLAEKLNNSFRTFPIHVHFPPTMSAASGPSLTAWNAGKRLLPRTDPELVQMRMMDCGLLFDGPFEDEVQQQPPQVQGSRASQTLEDVTLGLHSFVEEMERSGCFDSVHVKIHALPPAETANTEPTTNAQEQSFERRQNVYNRAGSRQQQPTEPLQGTLEVILKEKKWYKLYMGGGIKQQGLGPQSSGGGGIQTLDSTTTMPKLQFETSASLLNLRGFTDVTSLSYSVDQTSTSTVQAVHQLPLYALFPRYSWAQRQVLLSEGGSKAHAVLRASKDTVDFESTRSYKEVLRDVSLRVSNVGFVSIPEMADGPWKALHLSSQWRDLLPRRHPSSPYTCDASPDICSQAGPSLKTSLSYEYKMNHSQCNDRYNPTQGHDVSYRAEIAGPPGDVGFVKVQGEAACHVPLDGLRMWKEAALHVSLQAGCVRGLGFGGLCREVTGVQDRFFVGGPLQLRGFQPAGIGPRARGGGASVPGGDALGGELYYTTTVAASTPFPFHERLAQNGLRLFGFANAGTLSGWGVPTGAMLRSTRVAVGGGLYCGLPMGRLELTYAVPLRYGPRDVRKSAQLGFGFSTT